MPAYFESGLMVGESAWHGMGEVIPADDDRRFDIASCIELSGLDWRVELARCFYYLGDDPDDAACDEIPGSFATVRVNDDGTIDPLGVVGSKYRTLQNQEAFEWFQPWLDTREVAIETAGSLKGGRAVWVLARILRGNIDVGGGDEIAKYLMLSTTHDGTEATRCGFTPIRIVCANTLAMAHGNNASKLLRVKHTQRQHDSLAAIREIIDVADQEFVSTGEQYARMLSCELSAAELRRYVKLVNDLDPEVSDKDLSGRMRNRIDHMVNLATNGKGQDGQRTVWAAYNGVTEYLTHHSSSEAERRLQSNLDGAYAKMNKRAFDLAVELSA